MEELTDVREQCAEQKPWEIGKIERRTGKTA